MISVMITDTRNQASIGFFTEVVTLANDVHGRTLCSILDRDIWQDIAYSIHHTAYELPHTCHQMSDTRDRIIY